MVPAERRPTLGPHLALVGGSPRTGPHRSPSGDGSGAAFTIGKGAFGSGKSPEQSARPNAPEATARRLQPALPPLPVHTSITLAATIGPTPIATAKPARTVETPVAQGNGVLPTWRYVSYCPKSRRA